MADDTDLAISFAVDPESISLSPIDKYQVFNVEGPVVDVGDAIYRVVAVGDDSDQAENLREQSVEEIEAALHELSDDDDFQSIGRVAKSSRVCL